jgi:hypothetical protein
MFRINCIPDFCGRIVKDRFDANALVSSGRFDAGKIEYRRSDIDSTYKTI